MDDLYLILGVEPNAKPEDIQERFRFFAKAFHPDKYSSPKQKQFAEEEFKKINNAYQILSNPRKRADYDLQRRRPASYSNYSKPSTNDVNKKAEETARQRAQEDKEEEKKRRANVREKNKEKKPKQRHVNAYRKNKEKKLKHPRMKNHKKKKKEKLKQRHINEHWKSKGRKLKRQLVNRHLKKSREKKLKQ
jgi:curved DNA-binding protein CbpA